MPRRCASAEWTATATAGFAAGSSPPDAWNQRGDGHTLADQMQSASGIGFEPASNDRLGGAMLIYSQLDRGELLIAESCQQLREAVPTRIHDPDRPDDIRKIAGDPLDDCIDALRYAVYSFIGPARAPEAAAPISTDPTVAMVQRRVAEQRQTERQLTRYLPRRHRIALSHFLTIVIMD